jgi:sugar (pentulose or hexulose) kinase
VRFYPHFTGAGSPYWKGETKGSFYGITLNTGKADMVRSLLEGIAFQIKINIDAAEKISGKVINELRLFGGGSKQEFWVQIIADATGLPVRTLYTPEVANAGAAMLAAKGIGDVIDISDEKLIIKTYEPKSEIREKYSAVLKDYLRIQSKLIT